MGQPIKLSIAAVQKKLKSKSLRNECVIQLSSRLADVKIVLSIISELSYEWIRSIWASNMDVKHNIYVIIEHNMLQNCPAGWQKCVLLLRLFCKKNIYISPSIITVVGHCMNKCYYFELQSPIMLLQLKCWVREQLLWEWKMSHTLVVTSHSVPAPLWQAVQLAGVYPVSSVQSRQ